MATVTELEPEALDRSTPIEPSEHYEVVDDRIVEEPPLGVLEGWIASLLDQTLGYHVTRARLGRVMSEVLFVLNEESRLRRRPDVAFVSHERWPLNRAVPRVAAWDVVPEIAVEIISPTDVVSDLMDKIHEYFVAGVKLVWVVYPAHKLVYCYTSETSLSILTAKDELVADPILGDFRLPLAQLFEGTTAD